MRRVLAGSLAAAALTWSVAACGAPTSGDVQPLPSVPYDLMSPASPATTAPTTEPDVRPRLYLVRDDLLVPVPAPAVGGGDVASTVSAMLDNLAQGPAEDERDRGLSSALGSDVGITLAGLDGSTALVDVRAGAQLPSAGRLPLAVGQIVLTVVSVPGVDSVRLTADGEPIKAPLPDGALTERPLVESDYASLIVSPTGTQTSL
jgi:hypothetical protein